MTKEEVRSISVSKMQLRRDSIVYDIGAGTGSVSIEMARMIPEGSVYAIERKEEAVALIRENQKKFQVPNVQIVHGKAPEAMQGLEVPTCVFGRHRRKYAGDYHKIEGVKSSDPHCDQLYRTGIAGRDNGTASGTGNQGCRDHSGYDRKIKTTGTLSYDDGANPVYVIAFGGISGQNDI
mgnify:FL=1